VSLVYHHKTNPLRVNQSNVNVVLHSLGSHEEDPLELVVKLSVFAFGLSVQLTSVHHGNVGYSLDCLVLLLYQRLRGSEEEYLLSGKPKIVVADDVD
jgi:hypothetical protein